MLTNITIEKCIKILEDQPLDLKVQDLYILDSLDCVLAEDIKSKVNIPPFDRSPLDDYAFISEE